MLKFDLYILLWVSNIFQILHVFVALQEGSRGEDTVLSRLNGKCVIDSNDAIYVDGYEVEVAASSCAEGSVEAIRGLPPDD